MYILKVIVLWSFNLEMPLVRLCRKRMPIKKPPEGAAVRLDTKCGFPLQPHGRERHQARHSAWRRITGKEKETKVCIGGLVIDSC